MDTTVVRLDTGRGASVTDVTDHVRSFLSDRGDGLVSIFTPHATAGLGLIETGSGTEEDLLDVIEQLLPRDDRWRHRHGSPGHGGDHVLPAFFSPSLCLPVIDGRPALGTWQSVVLVDPNLDNPNRQLQLSFLPG